MSANDTSTDVPDSDQRTNVREEYGEIAGSDEGCCGSNAESFDVTESETTTDRTLSLGYERDDLEDTPEGSNLGLGCGNPVAISQLEPGETVLDLGSGGGFDCFLAAREVGPEGRVIGVDMTPEMLERARENARESDLENVEFRLGEIEHLPVADESVDAIISNCVVNLSPAKPRVLAEAFRVLRPGGRLAISDLVATEPLPREVRENPDAVSACVGGAATIAEMETWLDDAGFVDGSITVEGEWTDGELPIVSARIEGRKPT
ncbi:arsenite S-adenosylmethyltransferase [Natronococcus pandeyae]|uniref:Arsenite methyltransferase n=1 Tax=Natronococcus pandeyae TaxID=2055836 RepID=A0A8J8Q2X9_9EURY|nr:arsenite S-adenosylmethyltransferase [Natronococcus pandeyae]